MSRLAAIADRFERWAEGHNTVLRVLIVFVSLMLVAVDLLAGPFVQFPILFLVPVGGAAWYCGQGWAFALSTTMPLTRLAWLGVWGVPWPLFETAVNAIVRVIVLSLFAYLVHRVAVQRKALSKRVRILEGLLPICSFCKRIRSRDRHWEQLEAYVTEHSEAQFTHGLCPECMEKYYGKLLNGLPGVP